MIEITRPSPLDRRFGAVLRSRKAEFVTATPDATMVTQHGQASIAATDWPGWPNELRSQEPVIETFVASADRVTPTSENHPFVSAWTPLAIWMNRTVRAGLAEVDVELASDGFITASLTTTALLEGSAHVDDDQFGPADSVSMVAIIGDLVGPRVAIAPMLVAQLRPMGSVVFGDGSLDRFARDEMNHCAAAANELVVFPQFGQVHAGPAAEHVAHLSASRQLLVMRAPVRLA